MRAIGVTRAASSILIEICGAARLSTGGVGSRFPFATVTYDSTSLVKMTSDGLALSITL